MDGREASTGAGEEDKTVGLMGLEESEKLVSLSAVKSHSYVVTA